MFHKMTKTLQHRIFNRRTVVLRNVVEVLSKINIFSEVVKEVLR